MKSDKVLLVAVHDLLNHNQIILQNCFRSKNMCLNWFTIVWTLNSWSDWFELCKMFFLSFKWGNLADCHLQMSYDKHYVKDDWYNIYQNQCFLWLFLKFLQKCCSSGLWYCLLTTPIKKNRSSQKKRLLHHRPGLFCASCKVNSEKKGHLSANPLLCAFCMSLTIKIVIASPPNKRTKMLFCACQKKNCQN